MSPLSEHGKSIFLQTLDLASAADRQQFLAAACGDDSCLRQQIEDLLAHHSQASGYLESPPTEVVEAARHDTAREDDASPVLDFLAPATDSAAIGRLGHYEILEVLGCGGFGVVLKARDTKLDRIVAIKTLTQSLASSATARKRFVREAKAAAAVKHENVVGIYHVSDDGPVPYLVMECVSGVSLADKLQQLGTLDLPAILRIGMQVASGLAAAHQQGLVHRDVKPGNILLENGVERVKITDFGLARAADDAAITKTGEVAGTPQYMSPEQVQGLPLDARSDLFSLGSVLYAMATGRSPFRAESTVAAMRRVCDDTPRPIREINGDMPVLLEAIISRLLAKQPSERFQTATEVAELLGQYLAHVQQPAIVSSPKPAAASSRHPSAARSWQWSVALIALVAVGCIMGLTEASGVTKVVPTVIRIVRGEGTLVIEVDDPTVQLSLDGEALSIRGAGLKELKLVPGKYRLHAKKDGQPVKDEVVTITRDGRKVVTVSLEGSAGSDAPSEARAVEPPVGELKLLAKFDGHTGFVHGVAFSSDGRRIISVGRDQLVRIWNLQTHSVLSTLPVKMGAEDVSADGRFVAGLSWESSKAVARVWDIEKGKVVCQFAPELGPGYNCIRFTPDGTRLLTSGEVLRYGVLWDAATGRELGRFDTGDIQSVRQAAFSPDGHLLAIGAAGRVRLFDSERCEMVRDITLPSNRGVQDATFAAGGETLAIAQINGAISMVDVGSGRLMKTWQNSNSTISRMRFLAKDRLLLTTSHDGTLRVWDVEQEKVVAMAVTEQGTCHRVAVSSDGREIITAGGWNWDSVSRATKDYGDYALRLWQVPESVWPKQATAAASSKEPASASGEPGAFVRLGGQGVAERKFDTLAEAVLSASAGDTIEVRGNGPFVTGPIKLPAIALTIRAGEGYRPVIESGPDAWDGDRWIWAHGPLVLEGLEFRGGKIGPQKWGDALKVEYNSPLSVAHCRFVFLLRGVNLIRAGRSTNCEIRHCEFVLGSIGYHAVAWIPGRDGRLTVDGCIVAGRGLHLTLGYRGAPAEPCCVEFTRNTITGPNSIQLTRFSDIAAQGQPLSLRVADNVFDGPTFMTLSDNPDVPPLAPAAALAFVKQLVAYEEQRNTYSGGGRLLEYVGKDWKAPSPPDGTVKELEEWQRFWGQQATTSRTGSIHFEGGAAAQYANLNLNSREVTPADFRLRPDSAGYRAGPDGKDLGADVDLVGPGEAYERWKKTPEYQEWLKDSGQLRAAIPKPEPGAFVRLGGKGVAERKFDTLAEAVTSASDGDTIEVRGNGPFVTEPIQLGRTALTIRAGAGFRPVIKSGGDGDQRFRGLLQTDARLVLEGLEIQRVGPEPTPWDGSWWVIVYSYSAPLHAANCRFVARQLHNGISAESPTFQLRNCEFLCRDSTALVWDSSPDSQLVIANCLHTGHIVAGYPTADDKKPASIQLTNNTSVTHTLLEVCVPMDKWQQALKGDGANKVLRVEAAGNILGTGSALVVRVEDNVVPASEWDAILAKGVGWKGEGNLFGFSGPFLSLWRSGKELLPTKPVANLVAWRRFWGSTETGSVTGQVRYRCGDLLAKLAAPSEAVTPDDFRLRPDSAGYRAGPDGKDLGADVDLLGPGEAYERWKKTPEYQQWLEETGQKK